MSKDWDFYMCEVAGKVASIFLDLGIAEEAPVARLPVLAWVKLRMNSPRADGLSSQEEFDVLKTVEDALEAHLVSRSTAYVGRITADGCRDFQFYTAVASGWTERVADVLAAFPDYQFTCGTRADSEWAAYFDILSPSDEDRERIQNRRTCDALRKQGDRLEAPRPIEHWAYFRKSKAREAFAAKAIELGYAIDELIDPEEKGEPYGVKLSAVGIPSLRDIDALTLPLFRAARECNGEYDGWETQVVQ